MQTAGRADGRSKTFSHLFAFFSSFIKAMVFYFLFLFRFVSQLKINGSKATIWIRVKRTTTWKFPRIRRGGIRRSATGIGTSQFLRLFPSLHFPSSPFLFFSFQDQKKILLLTRMESTNHRVGRRKERSSRRPHISYLFFYLFFFISAHARTAFWFQGPIGGCDVPAAKPSNRKCFIGSSLCSSFSIRASWLPNITNSQNGWISSKVPFSLFFPFFSSNVD